MAKKKQKEEQLAPESRSPEPATPTKAKEPPVRGLTTQLKADLEEAADAETLKRERDAGATFPGDTDHQPRVL